MKHGFFIAGTDTGVGKTEITLALMEGFKSKGYVVAGMKPVASGCIQTGQGLRNEDASRIREHATLLLPYEQVNPYSFADPIAPHIAAGKEGIEIDLLKLKQVLKGITTNTDIVMVEGVGGWKVPLGPKSTMADLAVMLGLPVILVVGLRLGCMNHALLSVESIKNSGVEVAGWIANQVDPEMEVIQENIDSLNEFLDIPFLGYVPYAEDLNDLSNQIRVDALI